MKEKGEPKKVKRKGKVEIKRRGIPLKVEYVRVAYQNKKKTSFARARRSTRAS